MMRKVYDLKNELDADPDYVSKAQALTLNASKPLLGLKGSNGLFGSIEWWESIQLGRIKKVTISGVIEKTHFAGQDSRWGDQVNGFSLRLGDGSIIQESIYAKQKRDKKLFVPGARVHMVYALDELKAQPARDGGVNYSKVMLEVLVSEETISQ